MTRKALFVKLTRACFSLETTIFAGKKKCVVCFVCNFNVFLSHNFWCIIFHFQFNKTNLKTKGKYNNEMDGATYFKNHKIENEDLWLTSHNFKVKKKTMKIPLSWCASLFKCNFLVWYFIFFLYWPGGNVSAHDKNLPKKTIFFSYSDVT